MYSGLVNPAGRPDDGVSRRCSSGGERGIVKRSHLVVLVIALLALVAVFRTIQTYAVTPRHSMSLVTSRRRWNGWTDTRTSLTRFTSACARRHRATLLVAGERYQVGRLTIRDAGLQRCRQSHHLRSGISPAIWPGRSGMLHSWYSRSFSSSSGLAGIRRPSGVLALRCSARCRLSCLRERGLHGFASLVHAVRIVLCLCHMAR